MRMKLCLRPFLFILMVFINSAVVSTAVSAASKHTLQGFVKRASKSVIHQFIAMSRLPINNDIKIDSCIMTELLEGSTRGPENCLAFLRSYSFYYISNPQVSDGEYYILISEDAGGYYIGYKRIDKIYFLNRHHKILDLTETSPLTAIEKKYNSLDGFGRCGAQICAHFSIRPPANWNADSYYCTHPALFENYEVSWNQKKARIVSRKTDHVTLEGC